MRVLEHSILFQDTDTKKYHKVKYVRALCGDLVHVANYIFTTAQVSSKALLNNMIKLMHTWPPVYSPVYF